MKLEKFKEKIYKICAKNLNIQYCDETKPFIEANIDSDILNKALEAYNIDKEHYDSKKECIQDEYNIYIYPNFTIPVLKAKILLSELNQYYISNDEAKKADLFFLIRIDSKLMDINKYMPGSDLIEKRYEDLGLHEYFYYTLQFDDQFHFIGSNDLFLSVYNITEEDLKKIADENNQYETVAQSYIDKDETKKDLCVKGKYYSPFGATALVNKNFLKDLKKDFPNGCYILPQSISDLYIVDINVTHNINDCAEELMKINKEINDTLYESNVLTNDFYYYNPETEEIISYKMHPELFTELNQESIEEDQESVEEDIDLE